MNKKLLYLSFSLTTVMCLCACSDDNDKPAADATDAKELALQGVVTDYVNNSLVPTYRGLADASMRLADVCDEMCTIGVANLTEAKIQEACDAWIEARRYWELSEAWLYGAAADYDIDPHIDTWPLDKTAMESLLNNPAQMAQMSDRASAGEYVGTSLGQGLLGFHAIEYLIFEPANATTTTTRPRPVLRYTQNELYYLAAVADDLRNCCLRLEASWADPGTVSAEKLQILDDAELSYSANYGAYMKNAGQAGSIYVNYTEAVQEILVGAQDIADEVGNQKIGRPVGSGIAADPDYIESPYALNSINDFIDNLRSVRTAYAGYSPVAGVNEQYIKASSQTISAYVRTVDPELDSRVLATIDNAIAAISKMREPFASTSQDASLHDINFAAVEACNDVVDVFDEVIDLICK
ncbi:MAG: imelysin family protein [Muribaculaceae bacterium]